MSMNEEKKLPAQNTASSQDNIHEIGKHIVSFKKYVKNPYLNLHYNTIDSLCPDNTYYDELKMFPNHTWVQTPCFAVADPNPYILRDGRVSVCCRDYDGGMILGDIRSNSLDEIMQSKELKNLRNAHENNKLTDYPLCSSCYVSDDRLIEVFRNLVKFLIYKNPSASAEFYQEKINRFVEAYQTKNISSLEFEKLWKEF